jgi:hypothetical protein
MPRARPTPRNAAGARLGPWRRAWAFVAWLGRGERLDAPGPAPAVIAGSQGTGTTSRSLLRWLTAGEALPAASPAGTGEREESFLRWLFRPESPPPAPPTPGDAP